MRILHVVESLDRGGLERVVVNLALAQQSAGDEVAVACIFREGALAAELSAAGVRVTSAHKSAGLDLRVIRHLQRERAALHADVLHTHNAVANYYGVLGALGSRARVVNTRHGMGSTSATALKERLFRWSLVRTAAVAAVSEHARAHFVASGIVPQRLAHTVRNGIQVNAFTPAAAATRAAARARLGLPDGAYVVGTVGRLNWAKDHALLVDAFARLRGIGPGARLVLVGEGELRRDLEARILRAGLSEAVLLTGDRSDVAALLPAFDVFAMTSATEGYSIALLEAAAAGLPVVASDVGGNREIVQHGVTGIVVASRTPDAFARAMAELAAAPEHRERMGLRARAWVERHGSVAGMLDEYRALYSPGRALGAVRSAGA
jgi:glycosyltransferase involved in cell wall biosynthesis